MNRLGVFILVTGAALPTGAQVFYSTDRLAFEAAHPGFALEDFELGNIAPGNAKGCPIPLDANSDDDCFSPSQIVPGVMFSASSSNPSGGLALFGAGASGAPSKAIAPNLSIAELQIIFPGGVTALGVDMSTRNSVAPDTSLLVRVLDTGGTELDSQVFTSDLPPVFVGIESQALIGMVVLLSGEDKPEIIDNLLFGIDQLLFADGFEDP